MIYAFLNASVFALLLQNLVFNGGFGMSEAIRIATKPREFFPIALLVAFFTSATAAVCSALDSIPAIGAFGTSAHLTVYCCVLAAVYLIAVLIVKLVLKRNTDDIHRIGMAAVNTLVLAVPIINHRSAFNIFESIGLGIGAGLAFIIAVILIGEGEGKLRENDSIPLAFRGKPVLFIYIALISLGFAGLSGQSLFV